MQEKKQWEWEMLSIHSLTFVPETLALAAEDTISLQDEGVFLLIHQRATCSSWHYMRLGCGVERQR